MTDRNSKFPKNDKPNAQDYSKIRHIINTTKTTTTTNIIGTLNATTTTIVITTQETTLPVIAITTITKITSTTSIRRGPQGWHRLGADGSEADGS